MKIKFEIIKEQIGNDIKLPVRSTIGSAGYDFFCLEDTTIKPNEVAIVKTGVKAIFPKSVVLLIFPRSSLFLKHKLFLTNGVGVIDCDYANSDNDGHIMFPLLNMGQEDITIHKNDRVCQGVFTRAFFVSKDKSSKKNRKGGFGSTSK